MAGKHKLKRTKRTAAELLTEMGLEPGKLKKLQARQMSSDELKKLIEKAIEETPLPTQTRKSVISHVYDAMSVIVTAHGLWTFLQALMQFAASLTMSATAPKERDSNAETALAEAQALVATIDPATDALSIVQTLRLHIEAAIQEGALESGMKQATAESMATSMGLQIQRRLFIPGAKITLDPRTDATLTSLWQMMEG